MTSEAVDPGRGAAVEARKKLAEINHQWVQALIRGDTPLLSRLMAEDCIFSYALDGEDRAQFVSEIDSGELQVASLDRDTLEVRVYGSTGVVLAYDTADWHYKGRHIKGNYRTLHVYSLLDGLWQIVAIQASPIPAT
jgi:hypothetical protein